MLVALFGRKKEKAGGTLRTYEKVATDGFQAMKSGNEDKAILSFRKLLRWVTEDADKIAKFSKDDKVKLSKILTDAGEAMIRMKEYDSAIKLLEKAKTIDPKNFRAWMDIGRDLIQRNTQIPYALVCLREAAKLRPNDVEVHLLLGDAYRTQGQEEKSINEYKEVLRIDPENEDAVEKMLKLQPENVDLLKKYVKILEKKGNKDDLVRAYIKIAAITGGEEYIERGLKLDPENKDLLMHKVRILINTGKMDEAKQIVDELFQKYPGDPDVEMLAEELKPGVEEKMEEVKPIEVEEVFGDIGFEDISLEENQPEELSMEKQSVGEEEKIEQPEGIIEEKPSEVEVAKKAEKEVVKAPQSSEISGAKPSQTKEEEAKPEMIPEKISAEVKVEVTPQPVEETKKEEVKEKTQPEAAEMPAHPEVAMGEAEEERKKEEKVEMNPIEMFKNEIQAGNKENARKIMEKLSREDIHSFLNESEDRIKLILDLLEESKKYELAAEFVTRLVELNSSDENLLRKSRILMELGKISEAEKELNELLKRNMKNGYALYEKAKIMAIRGNEMGTRNFLMMATKFVPELKSKMMSEKYFEAYRDKDWFKKLAL